MSQRETAAQGLRDIWENRQIATPAFVFDELELQTVAKSLQAKLRDAGAELVYSVKACAAHNVLSALSKVVDGFACSSLAEIRLAQVAANEQTIHFTSPGLRPSDADEVLGRCDFVSLNSPRQLAAYLARASEGTSCGVRVNPGLSFARDVRYDPCRPFSKLGLTANELKSWASTSERHLVRGLHVHNNCESIDLGELVETVRVVEGLLAVLGGVEWVNLGGGYELQSIDDFDPLYRAVSLLRQTEPVRVFVEPGAALVRGAAALVTTVVDIIERSGVRIAVLDTTVNHWPEVFEYGYRPPAYGETPDGRFVHWLAGASCLAGDVFGEYRFDRELSVGSRVALAEAGAYSVVKANRFNGIESPQIYSLTVDGSVENHGVLNFETLNPTPVG